MRVHLFSLFLMSSLFCGGSIPFVYAEGDDDEAVVEDHSADPDGGEISTFHDSDEKHTESVSHVDTEQNDPESESESTASSTPSSAANTRLTHLTKSRPKVPIRKPKTRRLVGQGPDIVDRTEYLEGKEKSDFQKQLDRATQNPSFLKKVEGGAGIGVGDRPPVTPKNNSASQKSLAEQAVEAGKNLRKTPQPGKATPSISQSPPQPQQLEMSPTLATLLNKDVGSTPPVTPPATVDFRGVLKKPPTQTPKVQTPVTPPAPDFRGVLKNQSTQTPKVQTPVTPPAPVDFLGVLRKPSTQTPKVQTTAPVTPPIDLRQNLRSTNKNSTVQTPSPVKPPAPVDFLQNLRSTNKNLHVETQLLPPPVRILEQHGMHGGILALKKGLETEASADHLLDLLIDKNGKGQNIFFTAPTIQELSIAYKALKVIADKKSSVAITQYVKPLLDDSLDKKYKDHLWVVYGALTQLKNPSSTAQQVRTKIKETFVEDRDHLWQAVQDIMHQAPPAH